MGRLTQLQDTGRNYTATVSNDASTLLSVVSLSNHWNGSITEVVEVIPGSLAVASTFTYPSAPLRTVHPASERRTVSLSNHWNGNITEVTEVIPGSLAVASTFTYDNENRLTSYSIGGLPRTAG